MVAARQIEIHPGTDQGQKQQGKQNEVERRNELAVVFVVLRFHARPSSEPKCALKHDSSARLFQGTS
jgi:hypothetical protein